MTAGTPVPVSTLPGVGPRVAARLERLGVTTVAQLLLHLPLRYQDRTRLRPLGALKPGEEAVVEARVALSEVNRRGRRTLVARIQDGTGALTLRWFHFGTAQSQLLARGTRLRCFGEIREGPGGLEMVHPELQRLDDDRAPALEAGLTPVYPTTEGLSQTRLRRLVALALAEPLERHGLGEVLPAHVSTALGLPGLAEAITVLHCPPADADGAALAAADHPARRRLAFEELLAHHLSLRRLRLAARSARAWPLAAGGDRARRFAAGLPFALTAAQQRVMAEIGADLARARPMLRLLQGDVGAGKTVVAAAALLQAVDAGLQAAVMAPTELLAEQHHRTLGGWLEPLGVELAWLSGRVKGRARGAVLETMECGRVQVVVGTHALFQDDVAFQDLALVVVDEQHRFGVHQRLALREKGRRDGRRPHQLIMTATPIPRTLAMSAYADLDTSVIDQLPPGRRPVATVAVPDTRREELIERVRRACRAGRQVYWVCTLVEESEALECQAAAETAAQLSQALAGLRVGLVHGRLRPGEKQAAMDAFKAGELDLLVATTVIEVGVDVPDASLMIIENAERLGLAQLHQLRGRVGRGSLASSCVLMYRAPLSEQARSRLAVLRESADGFEIASRDLALRGPGDVLGTRQTGLLNLRVADLIRDQDLLPRVQAVAGCLLEAHPGAVDALVQRWIGEGGRYAGV